MRAFINWAVQSIIGGGVRPDIQPRSVTYTLHPREAETIHKIAQDRGIKLEALGETELANFLHTFSDDIERPVDVARNETEAFRHDIANKLLEIRNEVAPDLTWQYRFGDPNIPDSTDVQLVITWNPLPGAPITGKGWAIEGTDAANNARQTYIEWSTAALIEQLMYERGILVSGVGIDDLGSDGGKNAHQR